MQFFCFVVKAFWQPQEVTSSVSSTNHSSFWNFYHCSWIRQPHQLFIIDDGNYLFSWNAL